MRKKRFSRHLGEHMAVCDGNYIRLSKLLGSLPEGKSLNILVPAPGAGLHDKGLVTSLQITESFKYTSTVRIILQQDTAQSAYFSPPEMLVRMYHDANTSEVVSYQHQRQFLSIYPVPNSRMYHADEKLQVNFLLMEWLTLCLNEGISADGTCQELLASMLNTEINAD